MKARKRVKVEVWLSQEQAAEFSRLAKGQSRTRARMLRVLIAYVNKGGPTACEILRGVASDASALPRAEKKAG